MSKSKPDPYPTTGLVGFFVKDRGAAVDTIEDMVGMTGQLTARNPRHEGGSIGELWAGSQEKSSLSL